MKNLNKNAKLNSSSAKPKGVWLKLIMLLTIIILSMLLWQQFSKTDSPKVLAVSRDGVVSRIQQLNRLETIAYNVDTVITSEKSGTWQRLWTDEQKGLFIAKGRVIAGVDLSQLSPEMVQITDPTDEQIKQAEQTAIATGNSSANISILPNVMITLPPVQIFSVYLDDVEVYDWQAGVFGMLSAEPEILKQAQLSAKKEVLAQACASGVMAQAEQNAKTQMQQLFAMTGAEVTVATQGAGACQPID